MKVISLTIFAMLAEQCLTTKTRFARYRVDGLHQGIVTLRFKLLDSPERF